MRIIRGVREMGEAARAWRGGGRRVGLVPTMGALHAGHMSLLARARSDCDTRVVSLFVNPLQFGPGEDFERYPRPFEADAEACRAAGVDCLFAPEPHDVYPAGFCSWVEPGEAAKRFEGEIRPGHFRGVATVVLKLFVTVQPHVAVFGQKDAQQITVLRRMVEDLGLPVAIVAAPTVREEDGLALSSRNRYLGPEERRRAPALYAALRAAAALYAGGERAAAALKEAMRRDLAGAPALSVDYAEVVNAADFRPVQAADDAALLIIAGRLGSTRLIDNLPLGARAGAPDAATPAPAGASGRTRPHGRR
jgi:pantoate--beta-alanine ligase